MWAQGIISILIAYFIGSFPTAYIITRMRTGEDIREYGSGNVGAHNVWAHVGKGTAIVTGVIDVLKGIIAVMVAEAIILNEVSMGGSISVTNMLLFIMGSALAVVVGHIWPVFLKFKGGNGIATTIGILLILMTQEVLIAIVIALAIMVFTRNPILSINISLLLTIPIAGGLLHDTWLPYVIFSLVLIAILVLNFVPTMRAAIAKAGTKENMAAELMRIEPDKPSQKGTNTRKKKNKA